MEVFYFELDFYLKTGKHVNFYQPPSTHVYTRLDQGSLLRMKISSASLRRLYVSIMAMTKITEENHKYF